MNFRSLSMVLIITIVAACAKPSIVYKDFTPEQIIHFSQVRYIDNISNYVVYLNKGDTIPLRLTLHSELLDLGNDQINLILKKRVYFRLRMPNDLNPDNDLALTEEDKQKLFRNIKIYLSADAKSWAPYTDIKALEQVLGIKGGSFSLGMGITKQDGVTVFVNVRTNGL